MLAPGYYDREDSDGPGFGICVCNLTSHLTEYLNMCDNACVSREAVSSAVSSFYRKHSQLLRTGARGFHEMPSQQVMGVVLCFPAAHAGYLSYLTTRVSLKVSAECIKVELREQTMECKMTMNTMS